ncbi:MAG TPA: hypothetical protein VF920_15705 [Dongiaceae bacterium]
MAALLWSKMAATGTSFYLLAFVCASLYPLIDHSTFAGLAAILLGWPWIDYLPSRALPLAIILNAICIYVILAILSLALALLRHASHRM